MTTVGGGGISDPSFSELLSSIIFREGSVDALKRLISLLVVSKSSSLEDFFLDFLTFFSLPPLLGCCSTFALESFLAVEVLPVLDFFFLLFKDQYKNTKPFSLEKVGTK